MPPTGKEQWGEELPGHQATAVNILRHENYGDPTPNMEMLARLWSAFLGIELTAEDASLMLVLLKVMREKQSGYKSDYDDNRVDICGWTNVLHQVVETHGSR